LYRFRDIAGYWSKVADFGDAAGRADDVFNSAAAACCGVVHATAIAEHVVDDDVVVVVVATGSQRRVAGFQRRTEASSHIQHTVQIPRTGLEEPARGT